MKGHIIKYYRHLKRENKEKFKEKKNDDWVATTTSKKNFIVYGADVINIACRDTSWVIDSSAFIHATN